MNQPQPSLTSQTLSSTGLKASLLEAPATQERKLNLHLQPDKRYRSVHFDSQFEDQSVTQILNSIPKTDFLSDKKTRKRGLVLTEQGWQKLEAAKTNLEFAENYGQRFTFEELSERTQLDPRTIAKILYRSAKVDKSSLRQFFQAFNLQLENSDYIVSVSSSATASAGANPWQDLATNAIGFDTCIEELAQLKQQILDDCRRLVILLGMLQKFENM